MFEVGDDYDDHYMASHIKVTVNWPLHLYFNM